MLNNRPGYRMVNIKHRVHLSGDEQPVCSQSEGNTEQRGDVLRDTICSGYGCI